MQLPTASIIKCDGSNPNLSAPNRISPMNFPKNAIANVPIKQSPTTNKNNFLNRFWNSSC